MEDFELEYDEHVVMSDDSVTLTNQRIAIRNVTMLGFSRGATSYPLSGITWVAGRPRIDLLKGQDGEWQLVVFMKNGSKVNFSGSHGEMLRWADQLFLVLTGQPSGFPPEQAKKKKPTKAPRITVAGAEAVAGVVGAFQSTLRSEVNGFEGMPKGARGVNYSGSSGVISDGSHILVPENTAAFVFSQAGIETVIDTPGDGRAGATCW